jgi:hypothetical protein
MGYKAALLASLLLSTVSAGTVAIVPHEQTMKMIKSGHGLETHLEESTASFSTSGALVYTYYASSSCAADASNGVGYSLGSCISSGSTGKGHVLLCCDVML